MANLVAHTGESTGGISAPTPASAHRRRRATPTRPAVTSVIPRRSPRPGRPTGGLVQVVVVLELAAVLVVYGLYGGMIALAAVAPVALGLTVLALVRRRRRWLVEWLWIYLAYSRRQRLARDRQAEFADPGLTPLLEARPGLSTSTITDRNRTSVGMIGDASSLSAVILVEAEDGPLRHARALRPLPLGLVAAALTTEDVHLASAQIVQHTQPAPAPHLPSHAVAARSYAMVNGDVPGIRLTWIALRFQPHLCRGAVTARGGGELGAQRALLKVVNRTLRNLADAGFRATALNETDLVGALGTSCSVNPVVGTTIQSTAQVRRTVEEWNAWR